MTSVPRRSFLRRSAGGALLFSVVDLINVSTSLAADVNCTNYITNDATCVINHGPDEKCNTGTPPSVDPDGACAVNSKDESCGAQKTPATEYSDESCGSTFFPPGTDRIDEYCHNFSGDQRTGN
jgi:hypothetical protein